MTHSPSVKDIEDFASYLGLEGIDADMYYESYYQLNSDDIWDEEDEFYYSQKGTA